MDDSRNCIVIKRSNERDFEREVSQLIEDGYRVITARYECFISNFLWYAIMVKEGCR